MPHKENILYTKAKRAMLTLSCVGVCSELTRTTLALEIPDAAGTGTGSHGQQFHMDTR